MRGLDVSPKGKKRKKSISPFWFTWECMLNLTCLPSDHQCLSAAEFPIKSFHLRGVSEFVATCTSNVTRLGKQKQNSSTPAHFLRILLLGVFNWVTAKVWFWGGPVWARSWTWRSLWVPSNLGYSIIIWTALAALLVILLSLLWKPKPPSSRWHIDQVMARMFLCYLASLHKWNK